MGGQRKNMSNAKRKALADTGRGPVGKTAVVGVKDRAMKRAHKGVFHKMSPKHLNRYVQEFAGKQNIRDQDTLAQMTALVAGLVGKRLMYKDLIADNGLPSGARS